jgi:hypothetical protein
LAAITSCFAWQEHVRTWLRKFVRKGVEQHVVLVQDMTYFYSLVFLLFC